MRYSFYFWIENKPEFFDALSEFKNFISLKINLRKGIEEYDDDLKFIEKNCKEMLDIWKNSEEYKDSEKVAVDNKIIDIEKIQDLLKHFTDIIDTLDKIRDS